MKEIQLTKGRVTKVDDEDYVMLTNLGLRWCVNDGYAFNGKLGRLHRYLLGAPQGVMVDHRNGDKLDNRRDNLRLCTNSQNQANRQTVCGKSKFKGVVWQLRRNGDGFWKAGITVGGEHLYLGCFLTDLEAARAYNEAAVSHFGEFAWVNDLTQPASDLISSQRRQISRATPSGFKGVTFDKSRGKWMAQLVWKGVIHLKSRFPTAEAAAKAYDTVAKSVHGQAAVLNF